MLEIRTPAFDAVLREVVEGVEAETGERFFQSLVRRLAGALSVDYAFVSELTQAGTHFRTRALWGRGGYLSNLELPLEGTPCKAVLDGRISHYPERVCECFPADVGLREWGVRSYCGVPLQTSRGEVVGHFAILDGEPMPDASLAIAVMRIFAARASAELDRVHAQEALQASEERLARVLDSAMDAIVTFDDQRCIELFNDAAERVFGCAVDAVIGGPLDRFLGERLAQVIARSCTAILDGSDGAHRYLSAPDGLTAKRAGGGEFPIEATLSHAWVNGRNLFTLILRDIDALKRTQAELQRMSRHNEYLEEEIKSVHHFDDIVGRSPALGAVLEKVALVARTGSSVLVLGETGTGKELVARAVHDASERKERPFVKVNCAALPAGLIESELFGHERGAFTGATQRRIGRFELADTGTLFLDEIGDMPLDVQTKLLRVLQEQQLERVGGQVTLSVDVRVIAATNRDLAREAEKGTFRSDLFYRLNVFPIAMPPLRERRDDIPLLVQYFLGRYAAKIGRKGLSVPAESMRRLVAYDWPGNVRELENVIERAVILAGGDDTEVSCESLGIPTPSVSSAAGAMPGAKGTVAASSDTASPQPRVTNGDRPAPGSAADTNLSELERRHIESALERAGWRIEGPRGAARILGMNPSTLRSRMKKLGIGRGARHV